MRRFPFRRRSDDDFANEVRAHLDLEVDRLIADGLSPDAARAAAHRAFGSVAIATERFYEASRWMWLEQLFQDLRYAWRGMRQSPAFVITTVATLAAGLGLLTIAFTIFNAYVLRPFAIRDPDSLHQIVWHAPNDGGGRYRWRDYDELRRRADPRIFGAVIGEHTRFVSSNGRPLLAAIVSLDYFDALGPAMRLGRGLGRADADGASAAAVLSHQAWTRLFDADPSVLGREIELNGRAYTIVGVLAPAFTGLGDMPRDVFVPVAAPWTAVQRDAAHQPREAEITVRLRPGVSRAQAEAALTPVLRGAIESRADVRAEVRPFSSPNTLSVEVVTLCTPVFIAFVLVLVTSCANVSNVMLARAIARHREIAVRLSIGASRGRIIRQLLTEGFLIAILAGAAGLCLAAWGLRAATIALFGTLPASLVPLLRLRPLTFDARVFLFALSVSAGATLLFALLPALQTTRISLMEALRGQGGAARGARLRSALVVGQVTVALVLVIVAATLARNGAAVGALEVGFETDGVMSVNVRGEQGELARPLAEALAADPRVAAVAVTSGNPLFNAARVVAASRPDTGAGTRTRCTFVSPEFFSILRMPIVQGRLFRVDEARAAAPVAIVSAATARTFWPGEDPIGKTIRIERAEGRTVDELPDYPEVTVIGTVGDIVTGMMVTGPDTGHIYLPMTAADPHATAILARARTDRDVNLDAEALQAIFRRVVPDPQIFEAVPLGELRALQVYPLLAASWLASLLGGLALALSVSGLYGVLTYTLSQRTKEIGIRMALGATARAVVRLVLRQSARLAAMGALIGVTITFAVMNALDAAIHLAAIEVLDAWAFAAGLVLVMAATLVAAYQPARRATRVDPSQTLRSDT